jgi:hypothetical protein
MSATYPVNWEMQPGEMGVGKLELRPRSIVFEGLNGGGPSRIEIHARDISAIRVARMGSGRLANRPTLVVERRDAAPIRIAGVAQPGIVSELAERLARLRLGEEHVAVSRVLVVIPLKPGVLDGVAALVRRGPPFDPNAADLERHHVFLTEHEAVFVFEGTTPETLERLANDAITWTAAGEWAELASGPLRVAEDVYDWIRPEPPDNVVFTSTPGPGDSDGGDLYAP